MKITKKVIAFSLATTLTLSPLMVNANDNKDMVEVMPINAEVINEKAAENEYFKFEGKIEKVNKNEGSFSILVKADDKDEYGMIFHISEKVGLVSDKTNDFTNKDSLKEGITVVAFYNKNTPVALSLPPQLTPEKVIVMDKDKVVEVPEEKPEEVEETSEMKVLNKMMINEKEVTLNDSAYKNKDGVVMIPLREISEALGYEVKWNNGTQSAELIKGAQWTSIKVGEDNYNFAKMLVKLGTAPEINKERTFVPFTFLEEVLKVSVDLDENGMAHIAE